MQTIHGFICLPVTINTYILELLALLQENKNVMNFLSTGKKRPTGMKPRLWVYILHDVHPIA